MLWSPRLSLSNFHVKLTAKGLFNNLQLLSGCGKNTRVFHAVDKNKARGAAARSTNPCAATTLLPVSPGAGPNQNQNQNHEEPPVEPLPDLLNGNGPPRLQLQTSAAAAGARPGPRTTPRPPYGPGPGPKPGAGAARAEEGVAPGRRTSGKERAEEKHLRVLLVQGNRRVEALATIIKHLCSEREEVLTQKQDLSLQLSNLKNDLAASSLCCERLQEEKEAALSLQREALLSCEQKHKEELSRLEERLRSFYQTEWDKVHQTYQEEADKYRTLMEQQVEDLRSRQEAELRKQEVTYSQEAGFIKQRHEESVQELQNTHQENIDQLDRRLKEMEASLSERIAELLLEKDVLTNRLSEEEEMRKRILGDRNLKDSATLYLQHELDSLKVVVDMKTSQLHQKDKKLMEMDKLVEANVKLEECLKKIQQENEDYKARMDKHAALSRQLSSEHSMLQQTLQKESKVNKRLSMENEELLWKLHNGDLLASPRRVSPTSPFHSPTNSASFPAATPLSPR